MSCQPARATIVTILPFSQERYDFEAQIETEYLRLEKQASSICSQSNPDQVKSFQSCKDKVEEVISNIGGCFVRAKYYRYRTGQLESFQEDLKECKENPKDGADKLFAEIKKFENMTQEMKACCTEFILLVSRYFEVFLPTVTEEEVTNLG